MSESMEVFPLWEEIVEKLDREERLTAVEQFVFDHEPTGEREAAEWRRQLQNALTEVMAERKAES